MFIFPNRLLTTAAPSASLKKKKHPNNTLSPKYILQIFTPQFGVPIFNYRNLFLINYYKTHNLVSNDKFKQLWDDLLQDQQKVFLFTFIHPHPGTHATYPQVWDTKSQEAHKAKKVANNNV